MEFSVNVNDVQTKLTPGMELIPKNKKSSISYLTILSYGRDTILLNERKNFQIGVVSPGVMIV